MDSEAKIILLEVIKKFKLTSNDLDTVLDKLQMPKEKRQQINNSTQIQKELKKLKNKAGNGTTVEGGEEEDEDKDEDNDAENAHKDREDTKVGEQHVAEELISEDDKTSKVVEQTEVADTKEET